MEGYVGSAHAVLVTTSIFGRTENKYWPRVKTTAGSLVGQAEMTNEPSVIHSTDSVCSWEGHHEM